MSETVGRGLIRVSVTLIGRKGAFPGVNGVVK